MKTIVVTTTLYGIEQADMIRFELACQMLNQAKSNGHPVVVLDGSLPNMHETLRKTGGKLVYPLTVQGMGPGRRLAFFYALSYLHIELGQHDGIVLWTEPEKPGIVASIDKIVAPIVRGVANVVIPKRRQANFLTYPLWQTEIEREYNTVYERETGRTGFDPAFGPVAFRASTLQKLLLWNPASVGVPDNYLNHWFPMLVRNDRVTTVEVDCPYPPAQRRVEEENKDSFLAKRFRQMSTYIKAYKTLGKLPKLA